MADPSPVTEPSEAQELGATGAAVVVGLGIGLSPILADAFAPERSVHWYGIRAAVLFVAMALAEQTTRSPRGLVRWLRARVARPLATVLVAASATGLLLGIEMAVRWYLRRAV